MAKKWKVAQVEAFKDRIKADRLAGISWKQTAAALGLSKSSYYNYLDNGVQDDINAEVRNHDRFVHGWLQKMEHAVKDIEKQLEAQPENYRFHGLRLKAYDSIFVRLQSAGYLPNHYLPQVPPKVEEDVDSVLETMLVEINADKQAASKRVLVKP